MLCRDERLEISTQSFLLSLGQPHIKHACHGISGLIMDPLTSGIASLLEVTWYEGEPLH